MVAAPETGQGTAMKSLKAAVSIAMICAALAASAAAPPAGNAVKPGEVIVEPSTLQSLGLEWPLGGDANRNSTVSLRYRKKGTETWRDGLPPLRLGGEETKYLSVDFTAPAMFA